MEKCNVCSPSRHYLNKILSTLLKRMKTIFYNNFHFFICFEAICLKEIWKQAGNVKWHVRHKPPTKKKIQPWDWKKNRKKIYCIKIKNKKRKTWYFYKTRVIKNAGAIYITDWRSTTTNNFVQQLLFFSKKKMNTGLIIWIKDMC